MDIINLTPHTLNIFNEAGEEIAVLPPSGQVARVATSKQLLEVRGGIPLYVTELGDIEGLPEPEDGTIFVVSGLFRSACSRPDLWQPGELLRNEAGQTVGCIGLSQ
jgi:hypothetical protein